MSHSQQVLHSLRFNKLKGIINLDEVQFDEKPLTAILGVNGCGKSTILHALACCYQPPAGSSNENFRFSHFFTPTTDGNWGGSSFTMKHSFRIGADEYPLQETKYSKQLDRWAPRYDTRARRDVIFIGIKTCVPTIETESYTSLIRYVTTTSNDELSATILSKVGTIFNRAYTELNAHNSAGGKRYAGLGHNGFRYSSLSMGAGEQRVLAIIHSVFNAPKYSLILIDEIDLLLHTDALKRLINILNERATAKSLQIVFTTHREAVLEMHEIVSTNHLVHRANRTYCFSRTTPDAIHRLTGVQERPLEIFVEDEMAKAIVRKELAHLSMQRFATVTTFGAATNCFTAAVGLMLGGEEDFSKRLFLLDGDVYRTAEERMTRIQAILSGTEGNAQQRRDYILAAIRELNPGQQNISPEVKLHNMIKSLIGTGHDEIVEIANTIEAVDDSHSFVSEIVNRLGCDSIVGVSKIVDAASGSDEWVGYITELRQWLIDRSQALIEV